MKGLNDLHEILTENRQALKTSAKNWDVWMENGTLKSGGMLEDENGYQYANLEYRAVVYVEKLPSDRGALLIALIRQYANQRERENSKTIDIEFDQTNLNGKQINLEITLQLTDILYMTEVEDSPIEWAGKKLAPGAHTLNIAETGNVTGGIK